MSDASIQQDGRPQRAEIIFAYRALERRRSLYTFALVLISLLLVFSGLFAIDEASAGSFSDRFVHFFDKPALILSEAFERGWEWFTIPFFDSRYPGLSSAGPFIYLLFDTINMAILSTLIGFIFAFIVTLFASRNICKNQTLVWFMRRVLDVSRAFPEILIALVLIQIIARDAGLVIAVIAISFHTIGALGKLFSEVVENADMRQWEGLEASGANWLQRVWFGIVPQVMPNFLSYSLLRLEINVRASAIIGFVGGGGIGAALNVVFGIDYGDELTAIMFMLVITIFAIDYISARLRRRLIAGEPTGFPILAIIAAIVAVFAAYEVNAIGAIPPAIEDSMLAIGAAGGLAALVAYFVGPFILFMAAAYALLIAIAPSIGRAAARWAPVATTPLEGFNQRTRSNWRWGGGFVALVVAYVTAMFFAFNAPLAISSAANNADRAAQFARDFYSYKVEVNVRQGEMFEPVATQEANRRFVLDQPGWVQVAEGETVRIEMDGGASITIEPGFAIIDDGSGVQSEIEIFGAEEADPRVLGDAPEWVSVHPRSGDVTAFVDNGGRIRITDDRIQIWRYFVGWENFFFPFGHPLYDMSAGELWSSVWTDIPVVPERPEDVSNLSYIWTSFLLNPEWQHLEVWQALGITIVMAFLGTFLASIVGLPLAFVAARRSGQAERAPLGENAATFVAASAALAVAVFVGGLLWDAMATASESMALYSLAAAGFMLIALLGLLGAAVAYMSAVNILARVLPMQFLHKKLFDFLRAVDTLVWSLIFIRAFGLGPLAGTAAIFFTDTGTLGKLYAEAIENADKRQVEGVASVGAGAIQRNWFGVFPQILPVFVSQGLYFLESNTRSATIIGILGAGGIGLKLTQAVRTSRDFENVMYMVVLIIMVVILMDTVSGYLRRRLIQGGSPDLEAIIERQRANRRGWIGDKGVEAARA